RLTCPEVALPHASIRTLDNKTATLKSSMTLSIPNASSNKLFDAQPSRSAAAPSIVIQPIVMCVSDSACRTASPRKVVRCIVSSWIRFCFVNELLDLSHVQIPGEFEFHFAVTEKLRCPFPCGPWKEILAFQSPAISALTLARYWPGVPVLSAAPPPCICIPGIFMLMLKLTLPTSTS